MKEKEKENRCYSRMFPKCQDYGVSLWKCPQFLFVVMGLVIIATSIISYLLGVNYMIDPEIIALLILVTSSILLVIAFVIIRSFEDLAESNKLKTEFVNIVSHQLRTPISNLKWGLDAIKIECKETIESQEYLQVLSDNIERMNSLISDLLTVSRIQQKKLIFLKEEVDLNKVVEECVNNFKLLAKANDVRINFEGDPTLPEILIDPNQIRIVVNNLIDNAIKYTIDGKNINIQLGKMKKKIFFKITDEGIGIPENDKKYIFQKFFRSSNVLKHQTSGTGLGLYISKAIIEESKGEIDFKSREGKGTTFWFTLPF